MLTYEARCRAAPEQAWKLVARPDCWSRWAPHVRGAANLGKPEVRAGARGAVLLLGVVPVPAQVTGKRRGRSWSWRIGLVRIDHRVERRAGGCTVAVELSAPAPLEALLRVSYGPAVAILVRNLARVAERQA